MSGIDSGVVDAGVIDDDSVPTNVMSCTTTIEVEPRAWYYRNHIHFPTDHPEIDGTGIVEVRDAIKAVIDNAPEGTYFTSAPTETYLVNGTNLGTSSLDPPGWDGRQNLWFDGKGCRFKQTIKGPFTTTKTDSTSVQVVKNLNLHRAFWKIYNSKHWGVWNVNHTGPLTQVWNADDAYDARYETQHVFDLKGNDDFDIGDGNVAHITGDHTYGDMFDFAPSDETHLSNTNGRVDGWTFHDGGRQGCTLNGLADSRLLHFDMQRVRHSMFDIEPNFTGSAVKPKLKNVLVCTGHLGNQRLNTIAAGNAEAIDFDNVVFASIDNDNANGWEVDIGGPAVTGRRRNFALLNSTSSSPFGDTTGHGLKFKNLDGLTVTGNTLIMQVRSPAMNAVYAENCTGVNVHNNLTPGAVAELLVVGGSGGTVNFTAATSISVAAAVRLVLADVSETAFTSISVVGAVNITMNDVMAAETDISVVAAGDLALSTAVDETMAAETDISVVGDVGLLLADLDTATTFVDVVSVVALTMENVMSANTDIDVEAEITLDTVTVMAANTNISVVAAVSTIRYRRRRRRGISIGRLRIVIPGYGKSPYGSGPYGGL